MVRAAIRLGALSVILAEIFVIATLAFGQNVDVRGRVGPAVSHGASVSGQLSEDDPDEASSLIVTGDFNRDGIADIAKITSHADGTSQSSYLTVLLGQTNGTYRVLTSKLAQGRTPRAMVSGDFNNDGVLDLIIGDEDGTLTLFLGDGTGSFSAIHEIAHLDSVVSIAVSDFNKDGILDVAISDWRAGSVTVLLGTGKASFDHMWSFPLRMRATKPHIAVADFNGDGVPDIAVVYGQDEEEETFDVMLGNGNGTFTIAPERGFTRDPNSHCNTL